MTIDFTGPIAPGQPPGSPPINPVRFAARVKRIGCFLPVLLLIRWPVMALSSPEFESPRTNAEDALFQIGQLLAVGRADDAERQGREALRRFPGHAGLLLSLCAITRHNGNLADALALSRSAVAAQPELAEAYAHLARAVKGMDGAAAIAGYRRSITLDPKIAEVHYNFANVLRESGRYDEATAQYRRAIMLWPDFPQAYFNHGIVLKARKDSERAVDSYRRAVLLRPDYGKAHVNLANTLNALQRFEAAVVHYETATALGISDSGCCGALYGATIRMRRAGVAAEG